jgi:competence protein ComEA
MENLPKDKFNPEEIWEKYKLPIVLGLVGLILVGIGTLSVLLLQQKETAIEILPVEEKTSQTIFVDLQGAVEKPGVYELLGDSRLNDLLILAGGLSALADREWVERNLNLAQKLVDGGKLYIPKQGERVKEQESKRIAGFETGITGKININTASTSELDSLWGIGEKRAQAIIDNRPYQSIEELLSRKIIPQNVYERIKDEITVY